MFRFKTHKTQRRPHGSRPAARFRPTLEILEDRTLPSVNVLVNNPAADTTAQDTQSETAIVLGSGSNIDVAFNDSESNVGGANHFTGFSQSTDGGNTFTDKGSLPDSAAGDLGDPSLARDTTSGTIYLSTLGYSQSNVIQVFRSTDNGATFGTPVNAAPGFTGDNTLDKDWMTVDNAPGTGQGNVYLTYTDFVGLFGDNGIYVSHSTDGGNTWSSPVAAGPGNTQGGWVTTGPDHAVYVAYLDQSISPLRIELAKSTDQGQSFSTIGTIATLNTSGTNGDLGLTDASGQPVRSNAFAQVVVNPNNPNILYAVYNDASRVRHHGHGKGGDKADIFFTESTDGGSTWSTPLKLNDDSTSNDQWQPGLAITPDGSHLGVFWYDRRNDPADSLIERYGVIGVVGSSVTFGANFKVSAPDSGSTVTAFPAVVNQDPAINSTYMGDYDQVVADNTAFYTTWGDNRLSDAAHVNEPDVRFAKIAIASNEQFQVVATPTTTTAGTSFSVTVTALKPDGTTVDTGYIGTVHFASTDSQAVLPGDYTFTTTDNGEHSFDVTLKTAGSQTVTVTDTANSAITGSSTVTVNPASAASLAFGQQPTNTAVNATITPAVTVKLFDAYGNFVTTDNTDTVSLAITSGTGTTGAALSGGGPVTASGGVATFAGLSIDTAGTGYTLTARSTLNGQPATATSASFHITGTSSNIIIEDFESGNLNLYTVVGASSPTAKVAVPAAHDGKYGLKDTGGNDWIYRDDAAAQVKEGDAISVWLQMNQSADGEPSFGFGASAGGTLSVMLETASRQFLIQENFGYGGVTIGTANQPAGGYQANHWYRLEVDWSTSGAITGKLFDTDGTTLLDTVTATTPSGWLTVGGIAFQNFGHPKYWDTVTDSPGGASALSLNSAGPAGVSDPTNDQANAATSNPAPKPTLTTAPTQPLSDESVNRSATAGTVGSTLSGLSMQIADLPGNLLWLLGPDHQADSLMALTQNAGTARLPSSNADLVNVAALDQIFSDSGPLLFARNGSTGTIRKHT